MLSEGTEVTSYLTPSEIEGIEGCTEDLSLEASVILDSLFTFKGKKLVKEQFLEFPREPITLIPLEVIIVTKMMIKYYLSNGSWDHTVISESGGAISIVYSKQTTSNITTYRNILSKYILQKSIFKLV